MTVMHTLLMMTYIVSMSLPHDNMTDSTSFHDDVTDTT